MVYLPTFWVFTSHTAQPARLTAVGTHIYHTYYEHAATILLYAHTLDPDFDAAWAEKRQLVAELRPYALKGNDKQFADLCIDDGLTYFYRLNDPLKAKAALIDALAYYPRSPLVGEHLGKVNLTLLESYFLKKDIEQANLIAGELIEASYPSMEESLRIGIHIALEAQQYDKAQQYIARYLKEVPKDAFILEIDKRLQEGDRVEELRLLFRQK